MRDARSRRGRSSTTRSDRTAVWDTKPRVSLRRCKQRASTQLSEREGDQKPPPSPPAPPPRLKPEMERINFVVFLRERKQGAGQCRSTMSRTDSGNESKLQQNVTNTAR